MRKISLNRKTAISCMVFLTTIGMISVPTEIGTIDFPLLKKDQSIISQASYTWHHDCSNVTGFVSQGSWNVDFESDWTITSGTLTSSGTYFYFPDISTGTLWHGPVYVYELAETYPLTNLSMFSVQYDVDNSVAGDAGAIWVYLADSSGYPIVTSRVVDDDGSVRRGTLGVEYRTSVDDPYFYGGTSVSFTEYQGTMDVWYDETYGVMGNVEGYGETSLYEPTAFEKTREIRYIVIMGGRLSGESPIVHARVLDILVQFETQSATTTTTTGTTSTTTTTTTATTTTTTTSQGGISLEIKLAAAGAITTIICGILGLIFKSELIKKKKEKIGVIVIGVSIIVIAIVSIIFLL